MPRETHNPVRDLSPAEDAFDSSFVGSSVPKPIVAPLSPDVSEKEFETLLNTLRGLVHSISINIKQGAQDYADMQQSLRLSLISTLGECIAFSKGMGTNRTTLYQYRYTRDVVDSLSPLRLILNERIDTIISLAGNGFRRLSTDQKIRCMEELVRSVTTDSDVSLTTESLEAEDPVSEEDDIEQTVALLEDTIRDSVLQNVDDTMSNVLYYLSNHPDVTVGELDAFVEEACRRCKCSKLKVGIFTLATLNIVIRLRE
jgi:hypothetical protein